MAKDNKIIETKAAPAPSFNIEMLVADAIKQGNIDAVSRLLDIRKELKDEWAKEEFNKAMIAFKTACPVIRKNKIVFEKDGRKIRYKYADLLSISEQIKKPLEENGLTYNFIPKWENQMIGISCRLTHKSGYVQITDPFFLPVGSESFMSETQKFGARITFAERYSLLMALGIATADEDTDAVEEKQKEIKQLEASLVKKIDSAKTVEELTKIGKDISSKVKPEFREALRAEYTRRKEEIESAEVDDIAEGFEESQKGKDE